MNGNWLTETLTRLGAFGDHFKNVSDGRPVYPYPLGQRHERTGRQPQHCKKGPGRRHVSGKKAA